MSCLPPFPAQISLEIDPQEILRLQGYRRPSDVPTPEVLEILQAGLAEAREAFRPRWVYQEFEVEAVDAAGCRLRGGSDLLIREIPERWGPITTLGLAVCTVGEGIEERIESLFAAREFPLVSMLDSLGSVAVEALAEGFHRQLCAERLAQDLKVTPRESPGYPRWAIQEQQKVFALLPAEKIGVRITEYCIMTPRKSISFAVGIGPEARMGSTASPCRSCDMRDCAYRRAPRRESLTPAWTSAVGSLVLVSPGEHAR
ncbi:MAG: hypothetical protein HY803_13020 [candidate division NC10 bacterium]|nr:hypothetical protein [candidate division NC10 bacterium]